MFYFPITGGPLPQPSPSPTHNSVSIRNVTDDKASKVALPAMQVNAIADKSLGWILGCMVFSPLILLYFMGKGLIEVVKKVCSCVYNFFKATIDPMDLKLHYKHEPAFLNWFEIAKQLEQKPKDAALLKLQEQYQPQVLPLFKAKQEELLKRLPGNLESIGKLSDVEKRELLTSYCLYLDFYDLLSHATPSEDLIKAHQEIHQRGSQLQRIILDSLGFRNLGNTCWLNSLLQFFITNLTLIDFGKPLPNAATDAPWEAAKRQVIHHAMKQFVRRLHIDGDRAILEFYQVIGGLQLQGIVKGQQGDPGEVLPIFLEAFGSKQGCYNLPMVRGKPIQATINAGFPRKANLDAGEEFVILFIDRNQPIWATPPVARRLLISTLSEDLKQLQGKSLGQVSKYFKDKREEIEKILGHKVADEAIDQVISNFVKPKSEPAVPMEKLLAPLFIEYHVVKIEDDLDFGEERVLVIPNGPERVPTRYEIAGAIVHAGGAGGGHYMALRRGLDGKDRFYDDGAVPELLDQEGAMNEYRQGSYLYLKKAPVAA